MSARRPEEANSTRHASGCFLIGATGPGVTATGEALIGSVSDDPYDVRTYVRIVNPPGMQPHVGSELVSTSEHTLAERGYFVDPGETTRGVNRAGLAYTCAMIFEKNDPAKTRAAASFADFARDMMTRCETVGDAISMFQSGGSSAPPFSVLLADAGGDLAHLEVGAYGISVNHHYTRENPGMVFAVNCYLSPQLVAHNTPDSRIENRQNNNMARRERGKELAIERKGGLDVAAFARILSDHANRQRDPLDNPLLPGWGYSICNHGTRGTDTYPHEDLPWGTVSAEIMQPSARLFWYAYGWPCGATPDHGDQIFQERSWGRFVPFGLDGDHWREQEITELTTTLGEITPAGLRSQGARDAVSGE